jgi:hypothetical protein
MITHERKLPAQRKPPNTSAPLGWGRLRESAGSPICLGPAFSNKKDEKIENISNILPRAIPTAAYIMAYTLKFYSYAAFTLSL